MVGKAKSKNVKAHAKLSEREKKMEEALIVWTGRPEASLLSSPTKNPQKGATKFAKEFGVNPTAFWRRIQPDKFRSWKTYLTTRQALAPAKEAKLVEFILEMADRGLPLTHSDIHKYATYLLNSGKRGSSQKLGKNWTGNFLDRHHSVLSTHWSSPLDSKRTKALTPEAVRKHFECVRETAKQYEIIPENDYGMDESPMILGFSGKRRVVGRAGAKQQHSRRDGTRDSVTVVETICADGTVLRPTVIFKAKTFQKSWGGREANPIGAQICRAEKGYMDGVLSVGYIKFFDEQTKQKANGRYRRLFVDNHTSHCTIEFLRYARTPKIIVVGYPPHCTHRLQGLDVVCFARVKSVWGMERHRIEQDEEGKVSKEEFIRVYARVREQAFTEELVKKAFEKTGIHPFDPSVITAEMTAPSRSHSTQTGAPLTLPSPVQGIRRAIQKTLNAGVPVTPQHSSTSSGNPALVDPTSSPCVPTPIRFRAIEIITNVRKSNSAALLSSDLGDFSSQTPIPALAISPLRPMSRPTMPLPPDPNLSTTLNPFTTLSSNQSTSAVTSQDTTPQGSGTPVSNLNGRVAALEARVEDLEGKILDYEAQLVVQDLYCQKANQKLYTKERKKKSKKEILADGGDRHMTGDAWLEADEWDRNEKARIAELMAEKKAWKKKEKEERKEADAVAERQWREALADARERKVKRVKWPRKPDAIKRCPTPERFAELKKSGSKKVTSQVDVSSEEDDDTEDEECG